MNLKTNFIITLILTGFLGLSGQSVDHWESIIKTGNYVKYFVPDSELSSDWNTLEYNDSHWTIAVSGVGYGDGDDSTEIEPCISLYLRYAFSISDIAVIEALVLDMDYDDAFVAYLNGNEIARANVGVPFIPPAFDQPADDFHEATLFEGELPERFNIKALVLGTLSAGENILCIEVHNENIGSSDLSSNAFLHAGINVDSEYFQAVADWFEGNEPSVFSGTLPVVSIHTSGQIIQNSKRIVADMGIIDNGEGRMNHPFDPFNNYDGKISIEIRGASSQLFPKKSFTIETQTDSGTNNNVALLGMPRENDWVLYAPYSDKSLLRNVISYKVYEKMGHWAPRTRYIDLYINEDYRGIYVLTEKIKQDKNRVDIAKLTVEDVSDTDISGGYILQIDRVDNLLFNEFWTSPVYSPIAGFPQNTFEYSDPDFDELSPSQSSYIRSWINDLDALLASNGYQDKNSGYRAYLDIESFVDYLIFHEFVKDVDAYRLSTFFYKASDLNGGKLHAGPPWDYNLTFGNMDYGGDIHQTYNWMYPKTAGRYWWPRLLNDPWFENEVYCRWDILKQDLYNEDHMHHLMDSSIQVMDLSIGPNFERWPVLGEWVWPNYFVAETYEEEIAFVQDWISDRLQWMDQEWGGQCLSTGDEQRVLEAVSSMILTPNPSDLSHSRLRFSAPVSGSYMLTLFDMNGRQIYQNVYTAAAGSKDIDLDDLSYMSSGVYLLRVSGPDSFNEFLKLIKN